MNTHQRWLSLAVCVLWVGYTKASADALDTDSKAAKIANTCHERLFLNKVIEAIDQKLMPARVRLNKLETERNAYLLAACAAPSSKDRLTYLFLSALAGQRAKAQDEHIDQAERTQATAALTIRRRIAALEAMLATQPFEPAKDGEASENAVGGGDGSAGTAKKCTVVVKGEAKEPTKCTQDTAADGDIEAAAAGYTELTRLPLTPDTAFAFNNVQITIDVHGTIASIANVASGTNIGCASLAGSGAGTFSGGSNHWLGISALTRKPAATKPTQVTIATAASNYEDTDKNNLKNTGYVGINELSAAIKAAQAVAPNTEELPSEATVSSLATTRDALTTYKAVTTGSNTKPTQADTEAMISFLGPKEKTIKDLFLQKLTTEKVQGTTEIAELDKPIQELAESKHYSKALGICYAMKEQKVLKPTNTKITETDATCEKKGKEDNCKDGRKEITENGEKKCVVDKKEAKKVEGGEKDSKNGTTNTTGSNSFLMKKAPLLLAVLLL
uniref:Variant surface glycoprotein 1125.251 n=1 Tax=Trypanosoma brucei TaxID=5691 RepID=A0A1J0R5H9_9TRYP|nr:variant surface glycoprotein 1125.251 [Trypanosoma brucei]